MALYFFLWKIPYLRSETHLNEMVETLCKEFEDYAQAKDKESGEPTIIRFGSITFELLLLVIV